MVSKQMRHDSFVTVSHIILEKFQFVTHSSGEFGRVTFQAFKILTEWRQRQEQASSRVDVRGMSCELVEWKE